MLVGNDGTIDRFVIDLRGANGSIPDGIVMHGGDGGEDLLAIFSGPRDSVNEVDDTTVEIGTTTITYTGLETTIFEAGPGTGFVNQLHGKLQSELPDGRQAPAAAKKKIASSGTGKEKVAGSTRFDTSSTHEGQASTPATLAESLLERAFSGTLLDHLL